MNGAGIFITFNGECQRALKFYRKCFGGQLILQLVRDMPDGKRMSKVMQNIVVSAVLTNSYFKLVGTDLTDDNGIVAGNNISILIECASDAERKRIRDLLCGNKKGRGNIRDNLVNVTDRFNVNWILSIK